jgi:molybdopterin-dependent oxidoreductase alpha subunit
VAWRNSARIKAPKRWKRSLWVGWKPYGVGETKPNAYKEMAKTAWENRDNLGYALRILNQGVCDGCALGVAGVHDWTITGVHLCSTRLNLLRTNTMGALDPAILGDVVSLRRRSSKELRDLGRLGHPMVRRKGERGFTRVSWDDALDLIAERLRETIAVDPERVGVYMTARGITNETYYVTQKFTRWLGTNNIDIATRICHGPSTVALKKTIGVGATTCSYSDVINSDLIVLFGSNPANAQPVFMKYLFLARKNGAKVAVVNPYREPGLDRYWVPSNVESAMFGTQMTDEFFEVDTGGDLAFVNGVIKVLVADGAIDEQFVRDHTTGFDDMVAALEQQTFEELERQSGVTREDMERFARMYASAKSAILIWSMGITQHEHGTDNVCAIANLGLVRGNVGRPGAGLMPIRGHSGVQGGAEMGAYATSLPGGVEVNAENAAALAEQYGFPIDLERGLTVEEMLEEAREGNLDVLYSSGGNFLEVLPAPDIVEQALANVGLRVHQDIVVTSQMLVDPADVVVLLPAATRYEQSGGGTETTTERRIAFSPEIKGPRPGEARSEWEIYVDLAARVDPERGHLLQFASGDEIRREIARVVPFYAGIETLRTTGDSVQWGGPMLCEGGEFPFPDGRARFMPLSPPDRAALPDGMFRLSTRRGKQFNSMVHEDKDPLTGAKRDAVFMAQADVDRLGLREGSTVVLRNEFGEMPAKVLVSDIRPGNLQVFWPEANHLLESGVLDAHSHIPHYNAIVSVHPA